MLKRLNSRGKWVRDRLQEKLWREHAQYLQRIDKKHNLSAQGIRTDVYLHQKAKENSALRGGGAKVRDERDVFLRRARVKDQRERTFEMYGEWEITFDAGVAELNKFYRLDLLGLIKAEKGNRKQFTILELGVGTGRAANEIVGAIPGLRYIATGVTRITDWKAHPNSRKIDWRVLHSIQLDKRKKPGSVLVKKRLAPNSIDFIHSNLGISYSEPADIAESLRQCHRLLRKGGKVLFTCESYPKIPVGYKVLMDSDFTESRYGDDYMQHVLMLEKV